MECSPFFCSWDVEVRASILKAALAVGSAATANMAAPPMRTSSRDTELFAFAFSLLHLVATALKSHAVPFTDFPLLCMRKSLVSACAKGVRPLNPVYIGNL